MFKNNRGWKRCLLKYCHELIDIVQQVYIKTWLMFTDCGLLISLSSGDEYLEYLEENQYKKNLYIFPHIIYFNMYSIM